MHDCQHFNHQDGTCGQGQFSRPSEGVCRLVCKMYTPTIGGKSRGAGDTIAKITKTFGITPCGGCARRQAQLNAMMPYKT